MPLAKTKYNKWLVELKNNIHSSRTQTALHVNADMLVLYWYIGKQLITKIDEEGWGTKVIELLANDLQKEFPDMKGFSFRNLKYMRQFAIIYPDLLIGQQPAAQIKKGKKTVIGQQAVAQLQLPSITQQPVALNIKNTIGQQAAAQLQNEFVQQPVAQIGKNIFTVSNPLLTSIPWGHHMFLMDKINDTHERLWYISKTVENNWSRAVLQYQIETDLYQRQYKTKKSSNFHLTLPKPQADLANQLLKDPYIFRFVQMGEDITERNLEQQLIKHIQEFIIELGAGFAFVGRQVKLKTGKKDFFIDLLFYHLYIRSFIVIELKMDEFAMEHTGQMNGYLNMVNKQLKHRNDNPSIGIILCSSKDNVEVDFALTNINHPIGVSEYKYSKSLPQKYKNKLPSAKQLQNEVKRFLRRVRKK